MATKNEDLCDWIEDHLELLKKLHGWDDPSIRLCKEYVKEIKKEYQKEKDFKP